MTKQALIRLSTFGILAGAAALTFMMPKTLTVPTLQAAAGDEIALTGMVRDFSGAHPDFNVVPTGGLGHYAGNVSTLLGPDGRPMQVSGVTDFVVEYGNLVPGVPYSARATVLGAAITSGSDPVPVTIQAETDTEVFEPFGLYLDPTDGDVNDGANPRNHIFSLTEVYSAATPLAVTATSWLDSAGTSQAGYTTTSSDQESDANGEQVATKVNFPFDGTVTSLSAYLEEDDDGGDPVRFALYSDVAGEPGALLAESAVGGVPDDDSWYTLTVPPTPITAGDYWLALGMKDSDQHYHRYASGGGQIRRRGHHASQNGFLSTWGSSSSSDNWAFAMYATYDSDGYTQHMTANSGEDSPYVIVLKNGDPVPAIPSFQSQSSILDFVEPYIDVPTGLVTIQNNQAIYLFELGTTNLSSPSADFQDLVILITLATDPVYFFNSATTTTTETAIGFKVDSDWTDSSGRAIAPHLYKPSLGDSGGTSGVDSSGGVSSPASFNGWYRDILGTNQSVPHEIRLTEDAFGTYALNTNAFYPVDDRLRGNEGEGHNYNFTYSVNASFTYDSSANQFAEFQGGDGAWLYVNGKLAIDLGGVQSGASQYADFSRLDLVDGETYEMSLFYANRSPLSSDFHFRTNVLLGARPVMGSVSAPFD